MWCQHQCQWHAMARKSHGAAHFYHLDLMNANMPLASSDSDTGTNGITWPKENLQHHFDHLNMRNLMMLLTMPSASCDADAGPGANGVTWPKKSCCTLFWSSCLRSAVVPLAMLLASHADDGSASGILWPRKLCGFSFLLSWCKECSGSFDNADDIIWCQHQCP